LPESLGKIKARLSINDKGWKVIEPNKEVLIKETAILFERLNKKIIEEEKRASKGYR
jgi:methionyl-tRNA synthetase